MNKTRNKNNKSSNNAVPDSMGYENIILITFEFIDKLKLIQMIITVITTHLKSILFTAIATHNKETNGLNRS
jgi:hypothetical protein